MFRSIFLLKKVYQNGAEFCDMFGMASLTPTKLAEGKINETRRSMPVDSARYKVTVWLCQPENFSSNKHMHIRQRKKKRSMAKTTDQVAVEGYGKMLESLVGGLSNLSRWSKPRSKSGSGARSWKQFLFCWERKGVGRRRERKREREKGDYEICQHDTSGSLSDWAGGNLNPYMRADCVSWLHHGPCYTFCVDDNVQHHCDRWAKHTHSFCDLRGRNK